MKSNKFAFQGIISLLYDISPLVVHLLYMFFFEKKNTILYIFVTFWDNKMKNIVGTIPKLNIKIVESGKIDTTNTQNRYPYNT